MAKILMTFPADGRNTKIEVVDNTGAEGGACLDLTQAFERAYSKPVGERQYVGDDCRKDPGERVNTR